jgi:hypothetical protein
MWLAAASSRRSRRVGWEAVSKRHRSIDILAISKDKTELLVVELKKGRASDMVVGQIQRYMGYVLEELAETNQFNSAPHSTFWRLLSSIIREAVGVAGSCRHTPSG